ncbi:MAG: septation protein A [Pseudomonadota bacterium]
MSDAAVKTEPLSPTVRLLIEIGPLAVFFIANWRFDIFTATGAFMVAITASLAASWLLARHIATMPLVTGVFVLVFGALTLYLNDDLFIKVKPTLVNGLFAAILFSGLFFGKSLLKIVFDGTFRLTTEGWRKLTWRWAFFFVFLAVLNEIVWRNFSTDFWVSFKVFGNMPITMVFAVAQVGLLQKYALPEPETEAEKEAEAERQNETL